MKYLLFTAAEADLILRAIDIYGKMTPRTSKYHATFNALLKSIKRKVTLKHGTRKKQ